MRISSFYIDGFGLFHDVRVQGLPEGLTLFLGENEAGKSTLLSFFRAIFFGFPTGRTKDNRYPPLSGGRHGGLLEVIDDKGGRWVIERYSGSRGGTLSITGPGVATGSAQDLQGLLGGLTKEVFQNIFAFSLSELQTFASLEQEGVKSALYGAALGTGGADIGRIETTLTRQKDELFKPRGNKPRINRLLSELEALRREIKSAARQTDRYEEVSSRLEDLQEELDALERRSILLDEERRCLETFWEIWGKCQEAGKVSLDLKRLRHEVGAFRRVIDREKDILRLNQRREVYARILQELPGIRSELTSSQNTIDACLGDLGPDWTEDMVLSFDQSLSTREHLAVLARELKEAEEGLRSTQEMFRGRELAAEAAKGRLEACRKKVEETRPGKWSVDDETLKTVRLKYPRIQSLSAELRTRRGYLAEADAELQKAIQEIDPGWNIEDLESFKTSRQIHEEVQRFQREFSEAEGKLGRIEDDIRRLEGEIKREEEGVRAKEAALQRSKSGGVRSEKEISEQKGRLRELATLVQDIGGLEREKRILAAVVNERKEEFLSFEKRSSYAPRGLVPGWAAWGLIALGPVVAGLSLMMDRNLEILFALIPTGVGIFFLYVSRMQDSIRKEAERERLRRIESLKRAFSRKEEELTAVDTRLEELKARRNSLARELGLGEDVDIAALRRLEDRLFHELSQVQQKDGIRVDLQERLGRLDAMKRELSSLQDAREEILSHLLDVRRGWADLLSRMGLKEELEPQAAFSILSLVEGAKEVLRKVQRLQQEVRDAEEEISSFKELVGTLGVFPEDSLQDLDALLNALDGLFNQWDQRQKALEREKAALEDLAQAEEELKKCKEALEKAREEKGRAERGQGEVRARFEAWLKEISLPEGLSPEGVSRAIETVSKCREAISSRDRHSARLQGLEKEKREFEHRVRELLEGLSLDMDILSGLGYALELLQKAKNLQEELRRLEWQEQQLVGELQERWNSFMEYFTRVSEELKEERFWQKMGALFEKGFLESALSRINPADLEDMEEHRAELEKARKEIRQRRDALIQEKAELLHEQKALASSDELLKLRAREEELKGKIQGLAREWAICAMATHLLEEAKRRFEEEHQPKVLKDAGRFFQTITQGRYIKVTASLDGSGLKVVDAEGLTKDPKTLSRGTAEQLYLCLRFAYILNYSFGGETIPVVMDEILVNFDPARARQAARAIADLARLRQVLFFTCHPRTAELFRRETDISGLYQIREGEILPWRS